MAKVVHFEIPADDIGRAVKFYHEAFGWSFRKWDAPMDYWLAEAGPVDEPGINGAVYPRLSARDGVINTIVVTSLADAEAKVRAAGGTIVDNNLKVPGVGTHMQIRDTEGNLMNVLEPETKTA